MSADGWGAMAIMALMAAYEFGCLRSGRTFWPFGKASDSSTETL